MQKNVKSDMSVSHNLKYYCACVVCVYYCCHIRIFEMICANLEYKTANLHIQWHSLLWNSAKVALCLLKLRIWSGLYHTLWIIYITMCVAEILLSSSLRKTHDNDIAAVNQRQLKIFEEGNTKEVEIWFK